MSTAGGDADYETERLTPMEEEQNPPADQPTSAPVWNIPDSSLQRRAQVPIDRWNQQSWPPVTFGVPAGWSDTPVAQFAWLPVERRIPPGAPILEQTKIVASVEHPGGSGQPWRLQLRQLTTPGVINYVLDDPVRWAGARGSIGELSGPPEALTIGGTQGIRLTFTCRLDDQDFVFVEAWWHQPDSAYYIVASAPAADRGAWEQDLNAILDNVQQQISYPPTFPAAVGPSTQPSPGPAQPAAADVPVVRYRCGVSTQLPFTLHNVTSQQRRLVVLGSPATAAWAMLGASAMALYGRSKARSLEGQAVSITASGEVTLTDDTLVLHVVTGTQAGGVQLRAESGSQPVDLQVPYRQIRQWGQQPHGIWLDLAGRAPIWMQTANNDELARWLEHLSHGKTWQPPIPLAVLPPSAIGGWCQQDPRFTFAFPPGWNYFPVDAFADYARSFTPEILRCGVGIDAGQWEVQTLVIDCGPAAEHLSPTDPDSLAALLIEGFNPPGPIQAITLDGQPALLTRAAKPTPEGVFDRTYGMVVHHGTLFALWYGTVGGTLHDGSHERWLPDFHRILATWHWY